MRTPSSRRLFRRRTFVSRVHQSSTTISDAAHGTRRGDGSRLAHDFSQRVVSRIRHPKRRQHSPRRERLPKQTQVLVIYSAHILKGVDFNVNHTIHARPMSLYRRLCAYRSIRVHVRTDAVFTRGEDENEQRVPAYFTSAVFDVDDSRQLNLDDIVADLDSKVEHWNSRGSGYVLDRITRFTIVVTKYRPLAGGSSFLPTPQWLANKNCLTNVKSDDNLCFIWSVLASIYPKSSNPNRVCNYQMYKNTLNTEGLVFPLDVRDVPKFENMNESISINVLCVGDEGGFTPLHVSKHHDRPHRVNLLLLEGNERKHYVCIRNMSALVCGRSKHKGKVHVCFSCLHPFSKKQTLERHEPYCRRHPTRKNKRRSEPMWKDMFDTNSSSYKPYGVENSCIMCACWHSELC